MTNYIQRTLVAAEILSKELKESMYRAEKIMDSTTIGDDAKDRARKRFVVADEAERAIDKYLRTLPDE